MDVFIFNIFDNKSIFNKLTVLFILFVIRFASSA